MGVPLRYKLLVKNEKVFAFLYNNGKLIQRLNHEEIRVEANETLMRLTTNNWFGFVTFVPTMTMCCKYEEDLEKYPNEVEKCSG